MWGGTVLKLVLWNQRNYSTLIYFLFFFPLFDAFVQTSVYLLNHHLATTFPSSSSLSFTSQPRWLGEFHWVTGQPGSSWWLGGPPQMGSVSRGRWRRGVWGALAPTNGMASWAWLLAAVLLSLLTVSVARPPLTATKEEEATLEPEGKQQGMGRGRKEEPGRWSTGENHLFVLFLESRCKSCQVCFPPKSVEKEFWLFLHPFRSSLVLILQCHWIKINDGPPAECGIFRFLHCRPFEDRKVTK